MTQGRRVALIDDSVPVRATLRDLLEDEGFEIAGEAANGAEGLELIAREQPDAVVLDLAMPGMDGLKAIPEIRGQSPDVKIVVLSLAGRSPRLLHGLTKVFRPSPPPARRATTLTRSGTWTNRDVTVTYTCEDENGGSGLASSCPDAEHITDSTPRAGVERSASISDNAGNRSTSNTVNVKVDKAAPVLICPTSPVFQLNAAGPVAVTATVSDLLSGPRTETANGSVDVAKLGSFTTEVTGYDNAGNSHTATCGYEVKATFTGWSSPINNPNYMNKMKAGQAVPFKWRLTDANGTGVTTLTTNDVKIGVGGLNCVGSAPVDGVEEYAAGSSGLQNLGDGYYQVNWKSLSSYAGSCRTVTFDIKGASHHQANFAFTK